MGIFEALILGALQGLTEFLPVSSSGHLVLGEHFLGLEVANLKSFDVMVHLATFLAIVLYFWQDVRSMLLATWRVLCGRFDWADKYTKLVVFVIVGTLPAVAVGLLAEEWIDNVFRDVKMVGWSMGAVAIVFLIAELIQKKFTVKNDVTWWKALIIGLFQAVALIPGVSRSGSTIAAGLLTGMARSEAARFSFLLGLPAMLGAVVLTTIKTGDSGLGIALMPMVVGFVSSFAFGYLSIAFLMRFLRSHSLVIFAVYLGIICVLLNIW